jgi:mono/diheme cytochrome c family protein
MSKRPFIVFGLFATLCLLVIPLIALGKEGGEDAGIVEVAAQDQEAKNMFATNCGTCHTLAAAGTDGVVGPNLDQLLVPSGTNTAELYEGNATRVLQAVQCGLPPGGGRMPKGILEEEEAREVAQFVAAYSGQIGKGPVVDTADAPLPEPQPCPQG